MTAKREPRTATRGMVFLVGAAGDNLQDIIR